MLYTLITLIVIQKVAIAHGRSVEFCEATPIGLADES